MPFDPAGGASARDEAMARARRAANPEWVRWWSEATIEVARKKPYFTTDDIERLRSYRQGPRTHENRAIGPLMRDAMKNGVCLPTEDWVQSGQRVNHRRPMRVWFSLIYQGPKHRYRRRRVIDPNQFAFSLDPQLG
jgi:hypothetical protein